jgi:hypothetical protein
MQRSKRGGLKGIGIPIAYFLEKDGVWGIHIVEEE